MQFSDTAAANGRPASQAGHVGERSELDALRARCRSQALSIDALGEAVSTLRRGAAALKAENADLRAEHDGLRGLRGGQARALDVGAALAVRLACDVRAPGAARIAVAQCLRDRVAAGVLDSARLLVSELVTNSVRHSGGGPADAVIVRVFLSRTMVGLEVEDPGRGGVIAPRPPDLHSGGGFGLQLVAALSARWGFERVTQGGTIVCAQLPRTRVTAPNTSRKPPDRGPLVSDSEFDQPAARRRLATAEGEQP